MTWIVFFAKSVKRVGFLKNRIGVIQRGKLELNELEQTVSFAGRELYFTNREFRILHLFFQYPGQVFSKGQIYRYAAGEREKDDLHTVEISISRIRKKLRECASEEMIVTVHGRGYKWKKEIETYFYEC